MAQENVKSSFDTRLLVVEFVVSHLRPEAMELLNDHFEPHVLSELLLQLEDFSNRAYSRITKVTNSPTASEADAREAPSAVHYSEDLIIEFETILKEPFPTKNNLPWKCIPSTLVVPARLDNQKFILSKPRPK